MISPGAVRGALTSTHIKRTVPSVVITASLNTFHHCCPALASMPRQERRWRFYPPELCRGNFLVIVSGGKRLDFAAFVLILVLSVLLCWGMKETKTVNNGPPPGPSRSTVKALCAFWWI